MNEFADKIQNADITVPIPTNQIHIACNFLLIFSQEKIQIPINVDSR